MQKKLDDLFSALMLLAAIAVVLAGGWCLCHSIDRARAEMALPVPEPVPVAETALSLPEPLPAPTPIPEPDKPTCNLLIPLSAELQAALREACEAFGVPVPLALGVIEVESCFQLDAVSAEGCYGLMQLNPRFFPEDLVPADNLRAGVGYLGQLLDRYGDTGAALTAYNAGHDTGRRGYASVVLERAAWWEEVLHGEN